MILSLTCLCSCLHFRRVYIFDREGEEHYWACQSWHASSDRPHGVGKAAPEGPPGVGKPAPRITAVWPDFAAVNVGAEEARTMFVVRCPSFSLSVCIYKDYACNCVCFFV